MTHYEKMMNTKVERLCLSLSIPTVISMLITAIYSMTDTYFVSHIDPSASAAISVVFSLQSFIQTIGFTIGMGSGSLISRALGKKDEKKASQYASQGILLGLVLGGILFLLGMLLNERIMTLLGATTTSLPYAIDFAKYIFIASPFMILSFIMNNIIRSEGKAKLSMIGLGFGGLLNIGLDPLFIRVFHMGIAGAGLATMISQLCSFSILLSFFIMKKTTSRIWYTYISKDIKSYFECFYIGSPTLCRQGFATSANILLNQLAKPYGDACVAALGITAKIYLFVRNLIVGIGQGYQPVLGFSYGAKKYDRIRRAFKFTLFFQTLVSLFATFIVLVFPKELAAFFSNSSDVVEVGKHSIRYLAISLPFLGFSTIVNQSLQIIGRAMSASFLASLRQGLVYTPLIFLLNYSFSSNTGLLLTQPMADLLSAIITIPFFFYFFRILAREEKAINKEENMV